MEEDPLPRKNKSIWSKKRGKYSKNKEKEKSHNPDPESSPSILKEGRFSATGKAANKALTTATKRTPYYHKNKSKMIEASLVLIGLINTWNLPWESDYLKKTSGSR